jgi:hypothetical protein
MIFVTVTAVAEEQVTGQQHQHKAAVRFARGHSLLRVISFFHLP